MNETLKKYLISSAVTAGGVFLSALGAGVLGLTHTTITGALVLAVVGVAARAAVKAFSEQVITPAVLGLRGKPEPVAKTAPKKKSKKTRKGK